MFILQIFPELGETEMTVPNFIILLGVVLGFLLSLTGLFVRHPRERFRALLYFPFTLILLEIFLNRTGYMYYMIELLDFSEPFQYLLAPALYLNIKVSGGRDIKNWGFHLIPFLLYLVFLIPAFLAPVEYKVANYYYLHHAVEPNYNVESGLLLFVLRMRGLQLPLLFMQCAIYMVVSLQALNTFIKNKRISKDEFTWWFSFSLLFILLILVVLLVKNFFVRDIGDHIIAWFLTGILFLSTLRELVKSKPLREDYTPSSESLKPRKGSVNIDDQRAEEIKARLTSLMVEKKIFTDNLISLNRIGKMLNEPPYVVSWVLNEKAGNSFFEWVSYYRIEEAKRLLADPSTQGFTIEQIAEEVGYNSKSAFNKAFKRHTGRTPSGFRNQPVA
jgi:AraC-like DNA-binding protein